MIQLWAVPITVRFPKLADEPEWEDVWIVLSREDDVTPETWGEFQVGNASRLADPDYFVPWMSLVEASHDKWRDEVKADHQ